jgi:cellulose synthase/poly-beta-1,6-N-acetylglucosamine synthase-like glycosyltransferase
MTILFFIFLILLLYIYLLYPLILSLKRISQVERRSSEDADLSSVSLIIPAYNEEKNILEKLQNALEQNYPVDRYEIILTSDGSTDKTVPLARSLGDQRIEVVENYPRQGKNVAINKALSKAKGEIIIFSDANALFVKDAVKKLVMHFVDPSVGLVCGHLKYTKGEGTSVGKGEGLYFRYESWIKRLESAWGAVAVVTGSIYAMRRDLVSLLESDVANDFVHPVQVGAKGYKVLFEPEAIAYEQATASISEEFRRRARIVTRGFTAFARYWREYRILEGARGFCFISHKLLRWFSPVFLMALFMTNLFLKGRFFEITFWLQTIFYGAAFCGFFVRQGWGRIFAIPFYFCTINLAALVGFINFLSGKRQAIWEVATTTR